MENKIEINEYWIFVPMLILIVVMSVLGFWWSASTTELKKSLVDTVETFPETEYRVIEYSQLKESDPFTSGSMDIILNHDTELFNTEIKYINEKGDLQVLSDKQSIIVKYSEDIHVPKLIIKKVPTEKQDYKISDYVNPTLILPLEK
ncbi:hypothetical protein COL77_29360 [Bacillus wiedmannii]|uniref:hypothetical protein n=1 Tax=Bacillus wiedmannii TaxID=1890302 RepID=UPI000BF68545|nr:hypothetical protein [Bacillus wiedmannii]PFZ35478.1 hypothetical protein COL77_29360 [Bacillus wiedmannii]